MHDVFNAVILGIVEGLTEFLPVSSTGHLLVAEKLLGLDKDQWEAFTVVIQLGAILAVVAVYWRKFWEIVSGLASDPKARHFALAVIVAFLPAAIVGVLLIKLINGFLLNPARAPAGDRDDLDSGRHRDPDLRAHRAARRATSTATRCRSRKRFQIGLCQCLSLIPGVSRSGATILGGELARRRAQGRRRLHLLSRGADHARRLRVRALQAPRRR